MNLNQINFLSFFFSQLSCFLNKSKYFICVYDLLVVGVYNGFKTTVILLKTEQAYNCWIYLGL